jgi:hypothetical protein
MSHFTRIKTQIVEKEYLLKALGDLGYSYDDSAASPVRGYQGRQTQAEVKIATKNSSYEIGFVKNGASYEVVADWYGIREIRQQEFVAQLNQRYAYYTTRAKLEEQGFTLVNEENQTDGRIHLVVRRVV